MRKMVLPLFVLILFVIGCENTVNTPSTKVASFFHKYQNMDSVILKELDYVLNKDETMNKEQKKIYKSLLERQYQNLSYKIVHEEIIEDRAVVDVEIEVLNYARAIDEAKKYYSNHLMEFENESEYLDYELQQIKQVEDTTKYPLTIHLEKKDGIWEIEELMDSDREKIHGLYSNVK